MTDKRLILITALFVIISIISIISISCAGCLKAPDTDGDGVRDPIDKFPEDPKDWEDSDNDGIGDNAEMNNGTDPLSSDSDGDGYMDGVDLDPLNASIGVDTDGDGYHDAIDAFPDNASEWLDTDGDGYGDNSDRYPDDPRYHTSTLKQLTDFSWEELKLKRSTIYENNSTGAIYVIRITNNETLGGNFTITVDTCEGTDWTKKACEPGTEKKTTQVVYVGPGQTMDVKVKHFSKYMTNIRTFWEKFNVTAPEVEQPT